MHILDLDNQGSLLTAVETHLFQRVKGPCPDRFWGQRRKAFCPMLHPEQLEEVWRRFRSIHAHFLERRAHLLADRFRALGLADTSVMAQHINQGMIGNGAAIGQTASFEIGNPLVL